MLHSIGRRLAGLGIFALALVSMSAPRAGAVPAFAAQTGLACQACHVGGFGPQLTPTGREFKLNGYTLRTKSFSVPFSAMLVASYLHTQQAQNPPPAPNFSPNDNFALDQVSLFFAGGFGDHFGAFVQGTYDGVAEAWHWDNLDLRAVDKIKVKSADVTLGMSLNNAPSVQDVWNTLPAWGYPYTTSTLAPTSSTSPLLNGALAQTSLGLTGYAWINSEYYLEAGAYWSPGAGLLSDLGVDPTSPGSIAGAAPYARIAFQHDIGPGTLELGAYGMWTQIHPGLDFSTGMTDGYADYGVDGSYVATLPNTDVFSVNARLLHEDQSLNATCALLGADSSCAPNRLNDVRVDASYYWRDKIGLTVAGFETTGSANPVIYAANRTSLPDSSGVIVQLDGTPFGASNSPLGRRFNTRVGIQYTAYTQFNGASQNWDGLGGNASDNNTLRVFIWAAY
jgi:hypothetical protein